MPKFRRYGYDEVTMVNVAFPDPFSDRLVNSWIAVGQPTSIVRLTELSGVRVPVTRRDVALEVDLTT
jgi:hypothetical protein